MKKMNECIECYSADNRATPILHKRECLEEHEQYVCSTCGRCICMYQNPETKLGIIDFPFTTLEYAKLYLRLADYLHQKACSIFEYKNEKGEMYYRIFPTTEAINIYNGKNKDEIVTQKNPVFSQSEYLVFKACSIFEYKNEKGEIYYRIFPTTEAFNSYIEKNKDEIAAQKIPVFSQNEYRIFENTKTKMLSADEIEKYLSY